MVFPTIKHLEQIAPFDSADALLAFARDRRSCRSSRASSSRARSRAILLPGEAGYEQAGLVGSGSWA